MRPPHCYAAGIAGIRSPTPVRRYEMRRECQEILPGLLLGPFVASKSLPTLESLGITHMSVCFPFPPANGLLTRPTAFASAMRRRPSPCARASPSASST